MMMKCKAYPIVDPEHDLVALPHELNKLECLLQLQSLVLELGQQQLPEAVELVQTLLATHRII